LARLKITKTRGILEVNSISVDYKFNEDTQALDIYIRGQFNFSLVSEFRIIYASVQSPKIITINLKETVTIDSSGLGILLYLQKHFDTEKTNTRLTHCNPAIIKTLNMAQFSKLFTIS
jgi:anti-anti-sigma factor